jgi:hypothetical protein
MASHRSRKIAAEFSMAVIKITKSDEDGLSSDSESLIRFSYRKQQKKRGFHPSDPDS